jgi:hypothetical protein
MPLHALDSLIGQWFYAATLTGRYSGDGESTADADLALLRSAPDRSAFASTLTRIIRDTLTQDFWKITLPNNLETSSARSPAVFAYYAAMNVLGAPVLFSKKKIADLFDPGVKPKKKALDRHHLFPRAWLESQGITDLKWINQAANIALVEWPDDIAIGDTPPAEYVPRMRSRFQPEDWRRMCRLHALPDSWEQLPYEAFLAQRRLLMAGIIREGFEHLGRLREDWGESEAASAT